MCLHTFVFIKFEYVWLLRGDVHKVVYFLSKIDYLECVCADSLKTLKEADKPAVIATAVFFGQVRLIDNIML